MSGKQVVLTLPTTLLEAIDLQERDRGRFILEALERELARSQALEARDNLQAYADELSSDMDELLLPGDGRALRWDPQRGWIVSAP